MNFSYFCSISVMTIGHKFILYLFSFGVLTLLHPWGCKQANTLLKQKICHIFFLVLHCQYHSMTLVMYCLNAWHIWDVQLQGEGRGPKAACQRTLHLFQILLDVLSHSGSSMCLRRSRVKQGLGEGPWPAQTCPIKQCCSNIIPTIALEESISIKSSKDILQLCIFYLKLFGNLKLATFISPLQFFLKQRLVQCCICLLQSTELLSNSALLLLNLALQINRSIVYGKRDSARGYIREVFLLLLYGSREQDYQGGHIRQQFSQVGGYLNLFMYLGK